MKPADASLREQPANPGHAVASGEGPAAIVILRPDSIGDLILFEPLLRLLREAWSRTRIHVVGTPSLDAVSRMMPSGILWHVVEDASPFQAPTRESIGRLKTAIGVIGGPVWLLSACTRKTWWDAAVPALGEFNRRISLGPVPVGGDLLRSLAKAGLDGTPPGYPETVPLSTDKRERENVLECASYLLGRAASGVEPRLAVSPGAAAAADALLAGHALEHGRFVACCPAGTSNVALKVWPAGRFARVLLDLQRERGLGLLIFGTLAEEAVVAEVADRVAAAGGTARVWLGRTTADFEVLCGLLARAALYVGNDTGPMHAAAALNLPVVGVFGGGTWPRFIPRAARGAAVVRPMPCFGCDWQCDLGDAPCLRLVEPETVLDAARAALDGAAFGIVCEGAHASPEIDEMARVAARHARSLRERIDNLVKVCEEQTRYIGDIDEAKQMIEADKRALDGHLEVTKEEARQRLATLLEQNAFISDLEALVARLDGEKTALAARLEETRAALARKQELAAHLARQYEAAAKKAAAIDA